MNQASIIFDLDGTLWSSVESFVKSCNTVFQNEVPERQTTIDEINSLMGLPSHELTQRLFPKLSYKKARAILEVCFQQHIQDLATELPPFYPGVPEGLRRLSQSFDLFLVSNCDLTYLQNFLTRSGLGHFFQDSECAGRTGKSKAFNIRHIMQRNGIQKATYVGDTAGDALAAKEAGLDFVFVTYGCGQIEWPCIRVNSFPELVEKFLK